MESRRLLAWAALVVGCNTPTYLSQNRPLETRLVTGAGGASTYQSDTDLYVLPVRSPTENERRALEREQATKQLPMPVPWAGTRDFAIEIQYAVKNLESKANTFTVTVGGGNEFGDYIPRLFQMGQQQQQQQAPPPLMGGMPQTLGPNAIVEGIFREDQLVRAALDLEAITRYLDETARRNTPFEVILNNPFSPTGRGSVPPNDVTPAMVRFRFTLTSSGHVAFDYGVRVRDLSGKLGRVGNANLYVSTADSLDPPARP